MVWASFFGNQSLDMLIYIYMNAMESILDDLSLLLKTKLFRKLPSNKKQYSRDIMLIINVVAC